MEDIPVEVIGNILSHVAAARQVVVASTVCKKWREAAHLHLRKLRFDSSSFTGDISTRKLEVSITETILQTTCLRQLTLSMTTTHKFSAAPVIAWLMYTRETLHSLTYMIYTEPAINVLDRCGRHRLEFLSLGYVTISKVDPAVQCFPVLRSLTLKRVDISPEDLNALLTACPKLVSLSLNNTDPATSGIIVLSSDSLRAASFEDLNLDSVHVMINAPELESLCVKYCTFEHLEVVSGRSLRSLKLAHCNIFQMDMNEGTEELETVDICGFTLVWGKLHPMVVRANRLRTLKLWGSPEVDENPVDTETLALSFPMLERLSLSYDLSTTEGLSQVVRGESVLRKVSTLEVGSDMINEMYAEWIGALLERCPRLRRLVVCGRLSDSNDQEDYQKVSEFTVSIVNLMRKYSSVNIDFQFC